MGVLISEVSRLVGVLISGVEMWTKLLLGNVKGVVCPHFMES